MTMAPVAGWMQRLNEICRGMNTYFTLLTSEAMLPVLFFLSN